MGAKIFIIYKDITELKKTSAEEILLLKKTWIKLNNKLKMYSSNSVLHFHEVEWLEEQIIIIIICHLHILYYPYVDIIYLFIFHFDYCNYRYCYCYFILSVGQSTLVETKYLDYYGMDFYEIL